VKRKSRLQVAPYKRLHAMKHRRKTLSQGATREQGQSKRQFAGAQELFSILCKYYVISSYGFMRFYAFLCAIYAFSI